MQRYTKKSTIAANNNQIINNINIDPAKKDKVFLSLTKFIFFIDIAKKCEYAKIEDKIKCLGGTISLFFSDDVTHFITDKTNDVQSVNCSSPRASLSCSSPKTPELVDLKPNKIPASRARSRVDEMIHRARLETSLSQQSLLDVALLKNIRVWDFNFANLYLNKVLKKVKLYKSNIKKGFDDRIYLKEPFLKIEDSSNIYRPYYKIFKSKWPFVNLINCDLDDSETSKQDLIKENKIRQKVIKETDNNKIDKFGYCELCKCEYDTLSAHLKTEKHFKFASDEKNYEALDNLINEKFGVKYFIERNFNKIEYKNIEDNTIMTKLQYHDYFSKSANESEKGLCVQAKINRVTRQGQVNLESNVNGCRKKRNEIIKVRNRSSSDNHIQLENHFNYISEVKKTEKEAQNYSNSKDNPLYYKVIKSQPENANNSKNKNIDTDIAKPAIIVKFRKIRQSELSILNGEAENFMFPKTKSDIEGSKKQENEQKPNKRKYSNAFNSDEKSDELNSSESRKKSNTSETKLRSKELNNSKDYLRNLKNLSYSFERIPKTEPWYNVFCRQDSGKEHTFEYFGGTSYRKLPYEMGHIPLVQSKPYPNVCMLCKSTESNYHKHSISEEIFKKQNEEHIDQLNSSDYKDRFIDCNHKNLGNSKIKSNQDQTDEQQQIDQTNILQQHMVTKPFKKYYLMNLDMPRKSPREHASTLAMLSCLVKKSSSCQNSVNNDSKETTPEPLFNLNRSISTPPLQGEQYNKLDFKDLSIKKDVQKIDQKSNKHSKRRSKSFYNQKIHKMTSVALEKEIDFFLEKSYTDCLDLNYSISNKFRNSIDKGIDLLDNKSKEKFSNEINLDDILASSMKDDLSYNRPLLLSDGIISQKKRPVNKTGWPYKKKLLTRRQKGIITGFHHHKGVLVKKSSPWSFVSNILKSDMDSHSSGKDNIVENESTCNNLGNLVGRKDKSYQDELLTIGSTESPTSEILSVPATDAPVSETKSRIQIKSPSTQTTTKIISNSIAPPSPRVLRKPRGRWYRER